MDFPLTSLKLWLDPLPRSGPDNMAVDEWLLETVREPVLRVYEWEGDWGSLGCFCRLDEALEYSSAVQWVRRATGGGIVDHQSDWTYSLVIPETELLARMRAVDSYRWIHQQLSSVLSGGVKLVSQTDIPGGLGGICFEKPVVSDVVDHAGNKVAGAGQRRTKDGLLHQGSVSGKCQSIDSIDRSKRFLELLTKQAESLEFQPPPEVIRQKVADRYGKEEWTRRR